MDDYFNDDEFQEPQNPNEEKAQPNKEEDPFGEVQQSLDSQPGLNFGSGSSPSIEVQPDDETMRKIREEEEALQEKLRQKAVNRFLCRAKSTTRRRNANAKAGKNSTSFSTPKRRKLAIANSRTSPNSKTTRKGANNSTRAQAGSKSAKAYP